MKRCAHRAHSALRLHGRRRSAVTAANVESRAAQSVPAGVRPPCALPSRRILTLKGRVSVPTGKCTFFIRLRFHSPNFIFQSAGNFFPHASNIGTITIGKQFRKKNITGYLAHPRKHYFSFFSNFLSTHIPFSVGGARAQMGCGDRIWVRVCVSLNISRGFTHSDFLLLTCRS